MYKLLLRLRVAFNILKKYKQHWIFIRMDTDELKMMLQDYDFNVKMMFHGLREYNVAFIIKKLAESYDEDDMVLMKAEFEAKALGDENID